MTSLAAAAALLVAACSEAPAEAPGPSYPKLAGRVVDGANLLSPEQERRLAIQTAKLEREVGPQLVIVTVPDLQGFPIEQYGVGLGRHWGIGSKERNDGLLLIVAPAERKVRIEVGYGLEKRVSDHFAGEVIREAVVPRFRGGDFPGGIEAATAALIGRLRSGKVGTYAWEKEAA